jgi:tetratricopeptide (TPR) repeat protein
MNNLGLVLQQQVKYAEAEAVYRQTVGSKRRVLGDEHPSTRVSMKGLAEVLHSQGKLEEARFYLTQVIALFKRAADRPDAGSTVLNSYAWLLLTCELTDLRDPETALTAARRAVEVSNAPNLGLLDTLAIAYQMTGNIEKAVETQRAAVALLPAGKSSTRTELEARLGQYLTGNGSFAEAEQLLLDCYNTLKDEAGTRPEQVSEVLEHIVRLYETWEKPDKVLQYRPLLNNAD